MHEASGEYGAFVQKLKSLYEREKAEIEARFPKLLRKVAGYNLDHLGPPHANAAHLLVGSEGTLAYSERLHLKLSPLPAKRSCRISCGCGSKSSVSSQTRALSSDLDLTSLVSH